MAILVIDVGTSGVRVALVEPDGTLHHEQHRRQPPDTPFPGLVEFDPVALAGTVLELARGVLDEAGSRPPSGIAIASQRASTVVWDAADGRPVGPGLGWQDLRTAGDCLTLQAEGLRLAPNQSATKVVHLLGLAAQAGGPPVERLRFGTVDSWLVWQLTEGAAHVTDLTNAGVTGLLRTDGTGWDDERLARLSLPASLLPRLVDSAGPVGAATALPGAPPIVGIVGDQQASLVGQGCVRSGLAKITFGTGAMLDVFLASERPAIIERGPHGTFPIVALGLGGRPLWGLEAIMLAAGANVDWLRDDLEVLSTSAESEDLAAAVPHADGVVFVPHLLGEGTPAWDLGARGTLLGVTRGTDRRHLARAVLEGVAHAGADLVDAAEAECERFLGTLRIDGGMSANAVFVQALADATGRPVEVSPQREATALGAGLVGALGLGWFEHLEDVAVAWRPLRVVHPAVGEDERAERRERWADARRRASGWYPELSAISF